MQDYYKTLGVSKQATQKEIRAAYRRLARQYHPDINSDNPQAESRFKAINSAYDVLGDKKRRKDYDDFGENWKHADQIRKSGGAGFGGMGGFGGQGIKFEDILSGLGGLGDFFGGRRRRKTQPAQLRAQATISLAEVMSGTTRRLAVTTPEGQRQFEVRIPRGIEDNGKIVIRPKNLEMVVVVRVEANDRFKRQGNNLITDIDVPLKTALLGGAVKVVTLDDKQLELKIAAGTQNGKKIRMRGKGLPVRGKDQHGDMLAVVNVRLPQALSEQSKQFAESLEEL